MRAFGSDRVRLSGGKVILHARLSKGWTPRTEKSLTHAEFPGTTVSWEGEYYEVIAAEALPSGGVRYVLAPWPENHTIRTFEPYDDESEARLAADHQLAARQRKHSVAARLAAMVLGHAPSHVQMHLANELGLFPHRLTLWSIVPVLVSTGTCVLVGVDAFMRGVRSPIPTGFVVLTGFMLAESFPRFLVAMLQRRAMGSMLGLLVYLFFWLLHPNRTRLVSPFAWAKGEGLMSLAPSAEIELQDSLEMRGALLTLLTPAEQTLLAERYGFDYRKHAWGITWTMLVCGALGVVTMLPKASASVSALTSLIAAGFVVIEQVTRLIALRRGPAGSIFGVLVRPFARDLLRQE